MPRQPKLRPKTQIPNLPEGLYDFTAVAQLTELECEQAMGEEKPQRVFRVKRKHVLKACDRCRVKKTKVTLLNRILRNNEADYDSATESSPATAARRITIRACSGRKRLLRPRSTRGGTIPGNQL